jgi:hypothetical protein
MGRCKRLANGICTSQHSSMEKNGLLVVTNEKSMFMRRKGDEYMLHGLFVDDMMHVYSCNELKDEFLALYKKDFNITGGNIASSTSF